VTIRRQIQEALAQPRTVSWLARELGRDRRQVAEDVEHALRSARAAGGRVAIVPARCKACGFVFDEGKLLKPGKCPQCRGSRIFEALVSIQPPE
jgi:predicted Zn-ribbon and HTH transcriptional regulator